MAREKENRLSNIVRASKKIVVGVRYHLPGPRAVDHGVDHDVGDVDSRRPQIARHRLREAALRRLGGGEGDNTRITPDKRWDSNKIRARFDTIRGCRIGSVYALTEAELAELESIGEAPGSRN